MQPQERDRLFRELDDYLACHAQQLRQRAERTEPTDPGYDCPNCGNPCLRQHYRYGPGGLVYCPECQWEEVPF